MNHREIKYVIFVLSIVLLTGCIDNGGTPEIAFAKFFGEGNNDYGIDACVHGEIIYVLADVSAPDSEDKQLPCIYFLNTQGEFVEEPLKFNIDTLESENAKKLLMDDDENLYLVSNINYSDNEKIHIRKIKNREIVWEYTDGINLKKAAAADAILSDNEIAIVGNTENSAGFKKFYFLKINTEGNYITHENSGSDKSDDEYSKIIKSNSGYYVTGYTEFFGITDSRKQSAVLGKLNAEGDAIPKYYGSSRFNEGLCLALSGNSIILASNGRRTDVGINQLKVNGFNVNDDLSDLWETEFADNKEVVPVEIILNNNGFIIASNRYSGTAGNICLFSYDINGNYLGKKEFGSSRLDATLLKVKRVIALGDELLIVGSNEFGGNSDVALLKLNSNHDFYE